MLLERLSSSRRRPGRRLALRGVPTQLGIAAGATASVLALTVSIAGCREADLQPDSGPPLPAAEPRTEGSASVARVVPSVAEHAVDVADYTIRATLDPAGHSLRASGTIVWRNTSRQSVHELWLHLYLNAFKNEDTLFLRAPVGSGRGLSPVTEWGYVDIHSLSARELGGKDLWPDADKSTPGEPNDQTDVRVPLPEPVEPGATLTLDIDWEDKLPNIIERTGCSGSFCMVAQWFPKLARLEPDGTWAHFPFYHLSEFYADFGTYDVTLSVPPNVIVGATGHQVSTKQDHGRTEVRYVQADVHDFAFAAWDGFREKSMDSEGVHVRCLYPAGADDLAARELKALAFAIPHFGRRYGGYPYPVLTVVHPPRTAEEAGGMEYPTLITTGGDPLTPSGVHDVEIVTVHEFGHQYFYGLLASNEYASPVLDEGLNTYAELEAMQELFGVGSAFDILGTRIALPAVYRLASMRAGQNEPIAQPASSFATGADYGAIVYARTGLLLMSLAGAFGRDAFTNALGDYARRYRFQHPTIADFVATMRTHLGSVAAENLETALFRRGWVDYEAGDGVSHRSSSPAGIFERNGKQETIPRGNEVGEEWEGSALVFRRGNLELPVDIELRGEDGTSYMHSWDGVGSLVRIPYRGASRLASVVVDPASKIAMDEDLFNNALEVAKSSPRHRLLERAVYASELLLGVIMP